MDPSGSAPASAARFSPSGFLRAPVSYLLSYAGVLRPPRHADAEAERGGGFPDAREPADDVSPGGSGEVSIRIIGGGDQADPVAGTGQRQHLAVGYRRQRSVGESGIGIEQLTSVPDRAGVDGAGERASSSSSSTPQASSTGEVEADGSSAAGSNSYQRYDVQHFARWIEQILPFSLLLLVVFIRQHLQGFFVTIWIAAVMFKSNEILKNQTSLKGERKISVLVCFTVICSVHVVGFYWWYRNDDLLYPLIMVPLKDVPAFWNAVFVVMVNDTMVRQAAMIYKCILLIYYRNSKGRSYRRQGQMLTLVEYFLLLYRALVPTPVWYRFFLNKEYGSLFSSLTTGLYLTFKLTTVVEKVRSFITAFKALFHTEVQYGSHATLEQVLAAGDLCAICQEKMHSPILLRCKHIFCEDCVSEWFEREGTCPLCRTLVKPAELRSYSDGSTSLFFQLF